MGPDWRKLTSAIAHDFAAQMYTSTWSRMQVEKFIHWGLVIYAFGDLDMPSDILINTGLGNGLLPDGTKPLPEPMLSYHQGINEILWHSF